MKIKSKNNATMKKKASKVKDPMKELYERLMKVHTEIVESCDSKINSLWYDYETIAELTRLRNGIREDKYPFADEIKRILGKDINTRKKFLRLGILGAEKATEEVKAIVGI